MSWHDEPPVPRQPRLFGMSVHEAAIIVGVLLVGGIGDWGIIASATSGGYAKYVQVNEGAFKVWDIPAAKSVTTSPAAGDILNAASMNSVDVAAANVKAAQQWLDMTGRSCAINESHEISRSNFVHKYACGSGL
jgi:hypothetical protein